ncbi:SLAM family member 9 [Heterocephalus glaber]|uniref:SLAM family member 9 n=1 Tax=Heterocephalus glaber TaxID=10181 RepID=G5BGB0_HETGA|nr:SLAM family member 9 [Heterocephalus glaber]
MVEDITWVFFSGSEHTGILRVYNRTVDPTLLKLQDKYKGRVQTPSVTSLEIRNLSPQDSGQYMAQGWLMTGEDLHQVFDLKVYEPVSPPQILAKSLSVTAEWCNVTLECRPTGATEDLNVTWENKGLARELEQRGTPGPAPTPWTRAVSLPLSQANGSLSCVVSNPADQNRATSDLSDICPRGGSGQSTAGLTGGLLGGFVAVWTRAVSLPLSQANGSLSCVVSNPADQNRATSDLSDICPRGSSASPSPSVTHCGHRVGFGKAGHAVAYAGLISRSDVQFLPVGHRAHTCLPTVCTQGHTSQSCCCSL